MIAAVYILFACIVIYAAMIDVKTMRIPDKISLSVSALAVVYIITAGSSLYMHLAVALVCFAILMIVGLSGKIGGGDIKFISAIVLFLGPGAVLQSFLWATALSCVATALIAVSFRVIEFPKALAASGWYRRVQAGRAKGKSSFRDPIPAALPVCLGALLALWLDGVAR